MYIPFIGRLHAWEYFALTTSLLLVFLEGLIRIVTLALPAPIIHMFYRTSRRLFNYLSSPSSKRSRNRRKAVVNPMVHASDFVELCSIFGYTAEEHIVQTKDGYLLGVHRLGWRKGEEGTKVNSGPGSVQKKIVYLHHGLMMNSEVWVCLTEKERCLPFLLIENGYDVWLGNNRGNKYSKKSLYLAPTDNRFWAFSIDQFAFHDIPDSINYILATTCQPSLSYIGFSQGTAQAFATLSIHPDLNEKVDVFVALAPAMAPPGLTSPVVNSLVKASPHVLYLAFGRRAILGSAPMWQALLYPPIFVRLVDVALAFLFGWKTRNITPHQKLAAYSHLYSFTSTKSVVHWFQIIRNGKFQMFDDEVQAPFSFTDTAKYYKVAKFPTKNIKTPIVLLYGGSDSLVDISVIQKELPKHAHVKEVPHYEHLDFLWANDVEQHVFPHVLEALDKFAGAQKEHTPPSSKAQTIVKSTGNSTAAEDEQLPRKHSENVSSSTESSFRRTSSRIPKPSGLAQEMISSTPPTDRTPTNHPEGWWSSDDVLDSEPNTPSAPSSQSFPRKEGDGSIRLKKKTSRTGLEHASDEKKSIGT